MILQVQPQSQLAPFPSIISQDLGTTNKKFKAMWEERFRVYKKYSSVLMRLFRVIIAIRKA